MPQRLLGGQNHYTIASYIKRKSWLDARSSNTTLPIAFGGSSILRLVHLRLSMVLSNAEGDDTDFQGLSGRVKSQLSRRHTSGCASTVNCACVSVGR